ncbi:MAG TPA: translation initiation factor IF-3 [Aggregatilineales bacterium]|nr:translation initiation factor IF-3 [Anaerolineales bacterium]HRE47345.1 translation initiation factor IF-3 [Aggregatilineales bacterium]
MSTEEYRVNEQIRGVQRVRLIVTGADGANENVGLVTFREAMTIAQERGLDLVEVAPNADPPVCRVMDYSKFLYEQSKKQREARKAQKVIEVKEIRLQMKTNDYHLGFKLRDARRWLGEGMKVKVKLVFHGREITYADIARNQMNEIVKELSDVAIVEQYPTMEGRAMFMLFAPNANAEKAEKAERAEKVAKKSAEAAGAKQPAMPPTEGDSKPPKA